MPRLKPIPLPDDLPPDIPPEMFVKVMRYLASRAGKAGKGKAKARTSEQARAAITKRWEKERAKKKEA